MKIQIYKILPNPNNPRKVITPDMTDNMAASIRTVGLMSPIKVIKAGEVVRGKGEVEDEKAKDEKQGEYELISGHLRLEACKKLGWTEIEAEVLDISPDKARILAMLENMGQPMFWLDRYIGIEGLMAGSKTMTQKQAADTLGVDQPYVSRAMKILGVLNTGARQAIYGNPILSTFWDVPEASVFALTALATGEQDDLLRVEQALKVLLERHMTEQQAKKLVDWVLLGNKPEDFPISGKGDSVSEEQNEKDDPNAGYIKELPDFIRLKPSTGGNSSISAKMDRAKAIVFAYGGMSAVTSLEQAADRARADNLGMDTDEPNYSNKYADALPKLVEEMAKQEATRPQIERDVLTGKDVQGSRLKDQKDVQKDGKNTKKAIFIKGKNDTPKQATLDLGIMVDGITNQEPNTLTGKITKFIVKHGLNWMKRMLK